MGKLSLSIRQLVILLSSGTTKDKKINVLVFSKTSGYRHDSISAGLKMMSDLAQERKWILTALENANLFTPDFLKWKMGDHSLIWYQEKGNVRSFYTVFGHTPEAFQDPNVKDTSAARLTGWPNEINTSIQSQ